MGRKVEEAYIMAFRQHLQEEEREPATIGKYLRDVRGFAVWWSISDS